VARVIAAHALVAHPRDDACFATGTADGDVALWRIHEHEHEPEFKVQLGRVAQLLDGPVVCFAQTAARTFVLGQSAVGVVEWANDGVELRALVPLSDPPGGHRRTRAACAMEVRGGDVLLVEDTAGFVDLWAVSALDPRDAVLVARLFTEPSTTQLQAHGLGLLRPGAFAGPCSPDQVKLLVAAAARDGRLALARLEGRPALRRRRRRLAAAA
jgi:hypothetical protein